MVPATGSNRLYGILNSKVYQKAQLPSKFRLIRGEGGLGRDKKGDPFHEEPQQIICETAEGGIMERL